MIEHRRLSGPFLSLLALALAGCGEAPVDDKAVAEQEVAVSAALIGIAASAIIAGIQYSVAEMASECEHSNEATALAAGQQACNAHCESFCSAQAVPPGRLYNGATCTPQATDVGCITDWKWTWGGECTCQYGCQGFAQGCYEVCPNPDPDCCEPAPLCWEPIDCADSVPPLACEPSVRGAKAAADCEDPDTFSLLCETYDADCLAEDCVRVEGKSGAYQTYSQCLAQLRNDCGWCGTVTSSAAFTCNPGPGPDGMPLCSSSEQCFHLACNAVSGSCESTPGKGSNGPYCEVADAGSTCPTHLVCTSSVSCDPVTGPGDSECSAGGECAAVQRCKQLKSLISLWTNAWNAYDCDDTNPPLPDQCAMIEETLDALHAELDELGCPAMDAGVPAGG